MAQGGGPDGEKAQDALDAVRDALERVAALRLEIRPQDRHDQRQHAREAAKWESRWFGSGWQSR